MRLQVMLSCAGSVQISFGTVLDTQAPIRNRRQMLGAPTKSSARSALHGGCQNRINKPAGPHYPSSALPPGIFE